MKEFKLVELTKGLDVHIKGDPECLINGVASLQKSAPGHITFLANRLYRKQLPTTKASAVVLTEKDLKLCPANAIITKNPYYVFAKIAHVFYQAASKPTGIHPTAVIGQDSKIHQSAYIGAHTVIGNQVQIGAEVIIGPNCVIEDHVKIGEQTQIDGNVTLYHQVIIGKRVRISSGVVIGSDGFGFAQENLKWHKVPQMGTVLIGDDVDIGANTTIDRGSMEDTVVENGVKLDNLIQIGHNVHIGENTVMAGCTGVAGSAVIGKQCMIGGGARINGHIAICDRAMIVGTTVIEKSIHQPGIYASGVTGVVRHEEFKKNNARFHRLAHLIERVKSLETSFNKTKTK